MDQLIPVINKLQDVFQTVGDRDIVQLPQIVVVGAQSSGKSSVLENIVGRDFLPRGTGIVTRVPLIMQLIQRTGPPRTNEPKAEEWATFLHNSERIYTDFEEVRAEIEHRTVTLVGDSKNVSDKPIHLKIYSPHVLNLTLVDLPGITKVAVAGQPKDIEQQIRDLVLHYINNPNSIILAVSPANSDLANSDAIKIAQEVDPTGDRTIAVITKIDLMDRGTDATDVLTGRVIPVKLGLIGVVNRSQYDIDHKKDIQEALKTEAKFLAENYPALAHRCGVPFLSKTLNRVLMTHIRRCLPDLKQRIRTLLTQTQGAMSGFGATLSAADYGAVLLQVLTKFSDNYRASINGIGNALDIQTKELCGGPRIFDIFKVQFGTSVEMIDPLCGLGAEDILTAIRNASGTRSSLFIPESSFEFLAKKQISKLNAPSVRCVELVYEELERLVALCTFPELNRFRVLREKIVQCTMDALRGRVEPTTRMVEDLINIETAYISITNPEFESVFSNNFGTNLQLNIEPQPQLHLQHEAPVQHLAVASATPNGAPTAIVKPILHSALDTSMHPPPTIVEPTRSSGWTSIFNLTGGSRTKGDDSVAILNNLDETRSRTPVIGAGSQSIPSYAGAGVGLGSKPGYGPSAFAQPYQQQRTQAQSLSDKQKRDVEMMRTLICSYFSITRKRVLDTVPKAIMHFMVNHINDRLQTELVQSLYRPDHLEELMSEDPSIAKQRKSTADMLQALQRASVIITEVSESDLQF